MRHTKFTPSQKQKEGVFRGRQLFRGRRLIGHKNGPPSADGEREQSEDIKEDQREPPFLFLLEVSLKGC